MPVPYEPALANTGAMHAGAYSSSSLGAGFYGGVALTAFQLWSGFQQAEMIRGQAALRDRINEANARFVEYDAWEAERFGYTQAAEYAKIVNQTISDQTVLYAAQDIDPDSGTAKAIQEESKLNGYLNQLEIIEAGHKRAYGLKIQASNLRLGGDMARIQSNVDASAAQRQAIIGAGFTGYQAYVNRGV